MKRAKQKLHSRRGASILLAMLMILVATMVSAVIISAAVTTAKRVHDDTDYVKDEVMIHSAGRLIEDFLKKKTKYTYHTLEYVDSYVYSELHVHTAEGEDSPVVKTLSDMTEDPVKLTPPDPLLPAEPVPVASGTITLAAQPKDDGTAVPIPPVMMTYTLQNSTPPGGIETYTIRGEIFFGADETAKNQSSQRLFLYATLTKSEYTQALQDGDTRRYYPPEKIGEKPNGDPIYADPIEITGWRNVVNWTLSDSILLATSKDMLPAEEGTTT